MFLNTALIFCREPKTDDQLKAIMHKHPWAGNIYGFYNFTIPGLAVGGWKFVYGDTSTPPDSVFIEEGVGVGRQWLDQEFDQPFAAPRLPDNLEDPCWQKYMIAKEDWWIATIRLGTRWMPDDYHCYRVLYGQLEDEFHLDEAAKDWKDLILDWFDYEPKVVAMFEGVAW